MTFRPVRPGGATGGVDNESRLGKLWAVYQHGGSGGGGTDTHTVSATTPTVPAIPVAGDLWYDTAATTPSWSLALDPPRARATGGSIGLVSNTTWNGVAMAGTAYNTAGAAGGSAPLTSLNPVRFVAPVAGIYHLQYAAYMPTGTLTVAGTCLRVGGGTAYLGQTFGLVAVGGNYYQASAAETELAAAQYVEPCVLMTSPGGGLVLVQQVYFSARWVSPV